MRIKVFNSIIGYKCVNKVFNMDQTNYSNSFHLQPYWLWTFLFTTFIEITENGLKNFCVGLQVDFFLCFQLMR